MDPRERVVLEELDRNLDSLGPPPDGLPDGLVMRFEWLRQTVKTALDVDKIPEGFMESVRGFVLDWALILEAHTARN